MKDLVDLLKRGLPTMESTAVTGREPLYQAKSYSYHGKIMTTEEIFSTDTCTCKSIKALRCRLSLYNKGKLPSVEVAAEPQRGKCQLRYQGSTYEYKGKHYTAKELFELPECTSRKRSSFNNRLTNYRKGLVYETIAEVLSGKGSLDKRKRIDLSQQRKTGINDHSGVIVFNGTVYDLRERAA